MSDIDTKVYLGLEAVALANTQAMLEGTRVLWPEPEDFARLMKIMVRAGRSSFEAAKQNQPMDAKQCVFRDPKAKSPWINDAHRPSWQQRL